MRKSNELLRTSEFSLRRPLQELRRLWNRMSFLELAYCRLRQCGLNILPWAQFPLAADVRSIAIVGNAGYLGDLRQGSLIDSHQLVIRMNYCRVKGFESNVGSRTDILFWSFFNPSISDLDPAVAEAKWLFSPFPNNFRRSNPLLRRCAVNITHGMLALRRRTAFVPSMEFVNALTQELQAKPTTGLMACQFALQLMQRKGVRLYFTGFSFFQGRHHYFDNQATLEHTPHEFDRERAMLQQQFREGMAQGLISCDSVMQEHLMKHRDGSLSSSRKQSH